MTTVGGDPLAGKIAGFLQVSDSEIEGIESGVLAKIEEKFEDLRRQKSENLRISAALDQLKSQSENKLESFKAQIAQLVQNVEDSKNERVRCEEQKRRLIDEQSQTAQQVVDLEQQLEAERQQKELTEASKKDVLKSLDEKNKELEEVKDKLSEVSAANKELRQQLLAAESEVQTQKTNELREKSESVRLQQELTMLKGNNEWLTKELNARSSQLNELRETTTNQLHETRLKLSQVESELQIAQSASEKFKDAVSHLQGQLEKKLAENKEIKDDFNFSKQELEKENALKQRMVDALEKHMDSLKKEMEITKKSLDSSNFSNEERDQFLDEISDLKQRLEKSETECMKLQETIEELTHATKSPDPEASQISFSSEQSVSVIPKLYGDIGMLKKQLIIERRQKDELKSQVEAFVVELEHKIPVLNSFKDRTEMLEKELNEVTILLDSTGRDRDQKASKLEYLQNTIRSYESQISSLSRQRVDLARQIQFLLINQAVKSGSEGPLTPEELKFVENLISSEEGSMNSDSQSVITERLVEFRSIVELQQKNSELLLTTRKLASELEQKEIEARTQIQSLEDDTVKEAKETILALHDHAQNLENQLAIVAKERDVYKALHSDEADNLTTKAIAYPSSYNDEKVKDLEIRLSAVIQEAENNAKEWSSENSNLRRKLYDISLQFESEKTSRALAEDRLSLVQSTLELSKNQCEQLQKRSSELQAVLAKQDTRTQGTVDALIKTQSELSAIQSECSGLKSEKEFLLKIQKDLKRENDRLSKESIEYKVLIAQLQALQRERETLLRETQESYKEKLKHLENDLSSASHQLEEKEKHELDTVKNKESRYEWFQEKIDKLVADSSQNQHKLQEKECVIQKLQSEIQEQTAKLKEAEAKAQSYVMLNSVDDAQSLVEKLRQELEKTNLQLSDSYSQIEHFKKLSEQSSESLNEVSAAFETSQKESQRIIAALENERSQLQKSIDILNDQMNDLNNEISHQKTQFQTEKTSLMQQIEELQSVKTSFDHMKAEYERQIHAIQKDLEMQTQYASDAQKSYEAELQKHADVSKTITSLRSQSQAYKDELEQLKNRAIDNTNALENSKRLLEDKSKAYEEKISSLEERIEELSSQNKLLYDQVELLNRSEDNEEVATSNDLLISLRRERDVLETKLEVAINEQGILRQRLEIAQSNVQNANTQLAQIKSASSESVKLIEQHESMMKELEQLHLLRESNVTLRAENTNFKRECDQLRKDLKANQEKILPLQTSISSLQSLLDVKEQELYLSKEEAERWKNRSQDILHKYERIDPEEHGKLKDQIELVKDELQSTKRTLENVTAEKDEWESKFQRLKNQARDRLAASKEKEQSLTTEINDIKQAKTQLEEELQQSSNAVSELEEKLRSMTEEIESKEQTFNAQLAKLQEEFHTVQLNLENSLKQDASQESEEKIKSLTDTIQTLNKTIQDLETEASKAQELLTVGHTAVITEETSKIVEDLKKEFEAEKEQFIKDKEAELRNTLEREKASEWKAKESELLEQFKEKEKQLQEKLDKAEADATYKAPSEAPPDLSAIKAEWEQEYEANTLQRIKSAEEALKKRIRLPTQQKIDKIIEARKAVLEETFDERVKEKAMELATSSEDATISLEQHRKELEELKTTLRQEFDAELAEIKQKSFEEGKQQASLKLQFLQSKIKTLEKEKNGTTTTETPPVTNSVFQSPAFGSQSMPVNPFGSVDPPGKRPLDDEVTEEHAEKRQKEDESLIDDKPEPTS